MTSSDEEEVPLKEIREALRHDKPMPEWIQKITGHDVRVEELIEGDNEPGLGLYFRCEWCNPHDEITGRTWETEITFGEDSDLLNDYVKRHNKALWTAVDRALYNNDGLDMECLTMRYLHRITGDITKARQAKEAQDSEVKKARQAKETNAAESGAEQSSDEDDAGSDAIDTQATTQVSGDRTKAELDAMFAEAGGVKVSQKSTKATTGDKRKAEQEMDPPVVRPQAVDTVNITCGLRTMKFDVTAHGALVLSVDELAQTMGVVADSDTLLFTGRYMADRRGNHFVVSQDVLSTECTFTLSGRKIADADPMNPPGQPEDTVTYVSPLPKGTTNTFASAHLNVHTHTQTHATADAPHTTLVRRLLSAG